MKYDGDVLHILFRPSLGTVHAAVRRLEIAGKIKTNVPRLDRGHALRFYPNNPIWP